MITTKNCIEYGNISLACGTCEDTELSEELAEGSHISKKKQKSKHVENFMSSCNSISSSINPALVKDADGLKLCVKSVYQYS